MLSSAFESSDRKKLQITNRETGANATRSFSHQDGGHDGLGGQSFQSTEEFRVLQEDKITMGSTETFQGKAGQGAEGKLFTSASLNITTAKTELLWKIIIAFKDLSGLVFTLSSISVKVRGH